MKKSVCEVAFLLALILFSPGKTFAEDAADCIKKDVSAASRDVQAEIKADENHGVEGLEERVKEIVNSRKKLKIFLQSNMSALKYLSSVIIIPGITATYINYSTTAYTDFISVPNNWMRNKYLVHEQGGEAKLEEKLKDFEASNDSFQKENWSSLDQAAEAARIAQQEGVFKNFLAPFQKYSVRTKKDLTAQTKLLTKLSDEVVQDEMIFSDANQALAKPGLSAASRARYASIAAQSEQQLDNAASLWAIYCFASPVAEANDMDPEIVEKFDQARKFIMTNTDLKVYRQALEERAKDTTKTIRSFESH